MFKIITNPQNIISYDFTISFAFFFQVTSGEISFSLFGYSLATLDMNGDGLEDLVVGAPLYQGPTGKNKAPEKSYDHGAIFVYTQVASGKAHQVIYTKV